MMIRRIASVALLVGGCAGQPAANGTPDQVRASPTVSVSPVQELVAAERAFAARSTAAGTREAFLAWLAEDAVLFIPRAAPGRPFFESQPAGAGGRLEWAPIYAEVSRAGDLGFTTGPYEARANAGSDSVTAYGNFVSIWKRDAGTNAWKVAVDLGTTNGRPTAARRLRAARSASVTGRSAVVADSGAVSRGLGGSTSSPLGADSLYAARAASDGTAAAYEAADEDVRLYREGREPVTGRDAATEVLRRGGERLSWYPAAGVEAQASDLGYTYGTYGGTSPGAPEEGAYVRIWRRGSDGKWRLALDITNPFPR